MSDSRKLDDFSAEELLRELRARDGKARATAMGVKVKSITALKKYDSKSIAKILKAKERVVYGTDDRVDIFQLTDPASLADVDSVVALFQNSDVVDNGNGTSTLRTQNFGISENLCPGERFRNQVVGAFCSGFLVSPDTIATAGHCINSSNVTSVRFVFGFRMKNSKIAHTVINNKEIYRGVRIIGRKEVDTGADWALVKIDRPVTNHRVVSIRRSGKISNSRAVHVIGHPVGLPTKFAGGAIVRDNKPREFFVANLDTYGGNSGSPVYNSETHVVEGILVRGDADFVSVGNCNVSHVCPTTGCRGEDCTRTTEFSALLGVTIDGVGIDAALVRKSTNKIYFFKGNQFIRLSIHNLRVDPDYPKPIEWNWPDLPDHFNEGIDAALWSDANKKIYLFKGREYVRLSGVSLKVEKNYPKPIEGNWPGMPDHFNEGIDAALMRTSNGKIYLFKGSDFVRFSVVSKGVDPGFPKPIEGNWPGLPSQFNEGIDAALWVNFKIYFFKGDRFVRYTNVSSGIDTGYPKPIMGNWLGLPEGFIG